MQLYKKGKVNRVGHCAFQLYKKGKVNRVGHCEIQFRYCSLISGHPGSLRI